MNKLNVDHLVGSKVQKLRLAMGMSRKQLADMLGITHQQLQKYEKGLNRIAVSRLVAIASALHTHPSYFFEELQQNNSKNEFITKHQRMCLEVSRNFMQIKNTEHQHAISKLVRSLINNKVVEYKEE